jgi:hypothetical protein
MTVPPNEMQEIQIFQTQVIGKLQSIESAILQERESVRILSETLATHIRQNIDTMQKINEYIGEQMAYRMYRQGMEENNINLQLQQKTLELRFLEDKYKALETEHKEEDTVQEQLRYERDRQKLELENLRKNLEVLQLAKTSTKDKIAAMPKVGKDKMEKIKDTITLTAIGTLTAASVGGVIAFFIWLMKLYITSSP